MVPFLDSFVAVARAGSLNLAAERLHVSQPALSKQMQALEAELGVQLLARSPRGVQLTPAGRQVLRLAERAVQAAEGCRRLAASWQSVAEKRLVIAAGLTLTLFTLPPVIAAFRSRWPDIRLEVVTGDSQQSLQRLLAFEADVALVTTLVPHPEVQALPLFADPLVLVGQAGERLPERLAELQGRPLIALAPGSGLRQYTDQVLETAGVRTAMRMQFDSIEAVKAMVALGLGWALLPLSAVRADAAAGLLTVVRLADWPDRGRTVTLLRRRAGLRTGAVAPLTAVAREVLAESGG